jgi:hypothetical protein
MGSKSSESATSFDVLAFIPASYLVFSKSDREAYGPINGVYWYYYNKRVDNIWYDIRDAGTYSVKVVGFASSSSICLNCAGPVHNWGDTSVVDCDKRLSWNIGYEGGWRSGCTQDLNSDQTWRKLMYSCPGTLVTALTQCFDCVPGKYLDTEGNTNESACVSCGLGRYSDTSGRSACVPCGLGQYAPTSGMSSCVLCGAGKYLDTEGNTNEAACVPCGLGRYSNTTGRSACVPCGLGQYFVTL